MLALGMATLAVVNSKSLIEQKLSVNLSILDHAAIVYGGIALASVGALAVIVWLVSFCIQRMLIDPLTKTIPKYVRVFRRSDLAISTCSALDIDPITHISIAEFGEFAASADRNRWLFGLDNKSYYKITDRKGKLFGFFTIFRLSKPGMTALKRGDFDILTCPTEHLLLSKKYLYANVYIGSIYGKNRIAQAMAIGAVNQQILELRPRGIFARAASKAGLRLLTDAQFSPVDQRKNAIRELYGRS